MSRARSSGVGRGGAARPPAVLVPLVALLAAAAPARAQDAAPVVLVESVIPTRLEYTAAPGCYDEEAFHHAVASFMDKGRDPFDASAPVVLRVTFRKIRGGYRGIVQKIPANGEPWPEEDYTGITCEGVFRDIARLASLRVLGPPKPVEPPLAPAPPTDPIPPPEPPASTCPACQPCGTSQPPAPIPAPPKPPPWPMDLSVGLNTYVMMTAFFSANVGPAVGVAGEVRGSIFGISTEFRFALPSRTYATEPIPGATSGYPVEFDLSQVSLLVVPCARYKYFVGCGVAQLGSLIMQSSVSLDANLSVGFGPRLGFEVPFAERFAAFGFGEVLFSPMQNGFDFKYPPPGDPDGPIANTRWSQPVASGFFGVGVSVKFR